MDARFPLTIRAREFEPCHAAAARLGSRWGASDPLRFARGIGHPLANLAKGVAVRSFAQRAGLDADEVQGHSPIVLPATRTVSLRGQVLRLGDWSMRTRRRCPVCVDEDRSTAGMVGVPPEWWTTSRAWWDVRSVDACPEHGVRMLEHCRACGDAQTWRMGLLGCRCGAVHDARGAESADPSVAAYVVSRLSYGPTKVVPVLDAMPLVDAIRTMELLGAARLERRAVKPRRVDGDLPGDRVHGLAVAIGWPGSFRGLLDALVARAPAAAADGLMATYGWLYSEICVGDAPRATAELVAPVLRDHAVAHGVIARDEERLGASVPPTISATEAARRLGRSYATTRRLLDARDAVPEGSRRGVAFAIDPRVVDGMGQLRHAPPAAHLRIGRSQARGLMRDPRIAELLDVGNPTAADVTEAVLARATVTVPDGLVPLPVACRNMSVSLATACGGILSNRIRIARCGTVDEGLRAVLVRQSDLAGLREPGETLGVEAVARLGGIHHDAALRLVREGVFGPRTGDGVARDRVERFFAEHVTAVELARLKRTSSRSVLRTLAAAGIMPRFGPPECRQLIYLRADVPTVH